MNRFLDRNVTLKIISLIVAVILWGMTPSNRDPVRDVSFRDISVKLENEQKLSENGLMISSDIPINYDFEMRTKNSIVKTIDKSKVYAVVDLSEINKTGEQNINIKLEGLPTNIEIKNAPDINITIERIVSKSIPVLPKVKDKDALELGKRYYEINPRYIEVKGPESLIGTVAYAQLAVSVGSQNRILEHSLAVQILNDEDEILDNSLIKINPEYCIITIYPNRAFDINPIIVGEPADGYLIMSQDIKPDKILISGNPELLSMVETIDTDILDIEGAKTNIDTEVDIKHIEGARISPGQPNSVQIIIRIDKVIDRQFVFEFDELEYRNLPDEINSIIENEDENLIVTLKGPHSIINAIKKEDISPYLLIEEIDNLYTSSYMVNIKDVSDQIELLDIEPKELTLRFEEIESDDRE